MPIFGRPSPPRTQRIAIRHGGARLDTLSAAAAGISSAPGTMFAAVAVPASTTAIRLCFGNCSNTPVPAGPFYVCPSTTWADYANPTGGGAWKRGTFNYAGTPGDNLPVLPVSGSVYTATVPGNGGTVTDPGLVSPWWPATDQAAVYYLSDVIPVDLLPRLDGRDGRILFIRVLWPQGASVARGLPTPDMGVGDAYLGHGTGCLFKAGDNLLASSVSGTSPGGGMPFCWVEAITCEAGFQIVTGGDSQMQGDAGTGNAPFHLLSAYALQAVQAAPIGVLNAAWGGARLNQWFPHLLSTLDRVPASLVLIEGFSGNDNMELNSVADFRANAAWQIDRILAVRAMLDDRVPIVVTTPMPRNYSDPAYIAAWRATREPIRALQGHNIHVLDLQTIGEDPAHPGQWLPSMTSDGSGLHGGPLFNATASAVFTPLLRRLLGL
ncbi:SGNH/GDSL hydrolase family protein [Roseomonas sp. NAR14]|uniref:SGNH/GDSL hydrolase family protein n=1 Tax=Roseomonas acroporae TaxID=2937791 RepID=A0A9X2BXT0_9PROT|nr:SGNH/GDSL hydrolase family protein [Roseomonas acroporae]MCK8787616.1 SGNH/GDSL hydrolase family protein [Roseomonas acroporae]